jgi:hypothetical protein
VVQQEHLCRPRADAPHLLELGLCSRVVAAREALEVEAPIGHALRKILQ